jgi:hypothetical protein
VRGIEIAFFNFIAEFFIIKLLPDEIDAVFEEKK